jgi:hypothetical protein
MSIFQSLRTVCYNSNKDIKATGFGSVNLSLQIVSVSENFLLLLCLCGACVFLITGIGMQFCESGTFLTPRFGIRDGKNPDPGSQTIFQIKNSFLVKKYFNSLMRSFGPGNGIEKI